MTALSFSEVKENVCQKVSNPGKFLSRRALKAGKKAFQARRSNPLIRHRAEVYNLFGYPAAKATPSKETKCFMSFLWSRVMWNKENKEDSGGRELNWTYESQMFI